MEKSKKELWVLVTGASSGIGLYCALELAKKGHNLVLVARDSEKLNNAHRLILAEAKVKVEKVSLDLSNLDKLNEFCEEQFKNKIISILVNNAGMNILNKFHNEKWTKLEQIVRLNSIAPMKLMYLCIPHMLKHRKESYILNICSLSYCIPIAFNGNYSASKSYLNMLSQSVREELRGTNISVTSSCPGGVDTNFMKVNMGLEMTQSAKLFMRSPEYVAKMSISAMFSKKPIIVPGFEHLPVLMLRNILPTSWFNYLANLVMGHAGKKIK